MSELNNAQIVSHHSQHTRLDKDNKFLPEFNLECPNIRGVLESSWAFRNDSDKRHPMDEEYYNMHWKHLISAGVNDYDMFPSPIHNFTPYLEPNRKLNLPLNSNKIIIEKDTSDGYWKEQRSLPENDCNNDFKNSSKSAITNTVLCHDDNFLSKKNSFLPEEAFNATRQKNKKIKNHCKISSGSNSVSTATKTLGLPHAPEHEETIVFIPSGFSARSVDSFSIYEKKCSSVLYPLKKQRLNFRDVEASIRFSHSECDQRDLSDFSDEESLPEVLWVNSHFYDANERRIIVGESDVTDEEDSKEVLLYTSTLKKQCETTTRTYLPKHKILSSNTTIRVASTSSEGSTLFPECNSSSNGVSDTDNEKSSYLSSDTSFVYDDTYLGRSDVFHPMLTKAERQMIGLDDTSMMIQSSVFGDGFKEYKSSQLSLAPDLTNLPSSSKSTVNTFTEDTKNLNVQNFEKFQILRPCRSKTLGNHFDLNNRVKTTVERSTSSIIRPFTASDEKVMEYTSVLQLANHDYSQNKTNTFGSNGDEFCNDIETLWNMITHLPTSKKILKQTMHQVKANIKMRCNFSIKELKRQSNVETKKHHIQTDEKIEKLQNLSLKYLHLADLECRKREEAVQRERKDCNINDTIVLNKVKWDCLKFKHEKKMVKLKAEFEAKRVKAEMKFQKERQKIINKLLMKVIELDSKMNSHRTNTFGFLNKLMESDNKHLSEFIESMGINYHEVN